MAALIGFGSPIIFILIFIFINRSKTTNSKLILYSVLIYVLSLACGIGATILIGGGAIFAGIIFPVLFLIVFSVIVNNSKVGVK